MSYVGGEATEHYYVWSDDFILTHVFCPIEIHVLIGNVIQCVDPAFVVQGNEVDKLIRCDEHWVCWHGHPVWPNCHLKNGGRLWWLSVGITCHETPKAGRCF